MSINQYREASRRLHSYILSKHWDGHKLIGPDPIGRIHWRITRFVRSYLPQLPGDDRYIYLQAQAYWIRGNLKLFELTQEPQYLDFADSCADYIASSQPADGAWRHPPIWGRRGFISTVEGVWASLGLTAAYRETRKSAYLESALRWYEYQVSGIGFQKLENGLAANYYSHSNTRVPNATTMLIWLTGELYQLTGDTAYLRYTKPMLRFIEHSQLDSGELPYEFQTRTHFMCYQYNSFQFLDLAHYYQISSNERVRPTLSKMAMYLATGLTDRGSSRYDCFKELPEVNYWTAALAAALLKAHELNLGDYLALSERAYGYLLARQRRDGGFDFSERDYRFLRDTRSYPRNLSMILYHLLLAVQTKASFRKREFTGEEYE